MIIFLASYTFPGASGIEYPPNYMTKDTGDSSLKDAESSISTGSFGQSISSSRAPNVYINGLPPHFSEQELFALTRPYGEVKSVRTFTRHISEKPTSVFLAKVHVTSR